MAFGIPLVDLTPIQPDLSIPFMDALLANYALVELLPAYNNSVTIFARRPVPADAPYPMVVLSPDLMKLNLDGYDDQRPRITRDIAVYARNDTSRNYRLVEEIAYMIFSQFHHTRLSLVPPDGWMIADVESHGPIPAPTADDEVFVGRVVSIEVLLAQLQ